MERHLVSTRTNKHYFDCTIVVHVIDLRRFRFRSAGQGVGAISDVRPVAKLIAQLRAEYDEAKSFLHAETWRPAAKL